MRFDAENLKSDIVFSAKLRGFDFVFHSTYGLFSYRDVDEGSRMLIDAVQVNPDEIALDIGCGYGVIGLVAAKLAPNGIVHMVDKDFVAVDYARKNAAMNRLGNTKIYLSNAFSNVPDVKFDSIYTNIPAHLGKEMLYVILSDAYKHLKIGGKLYIVHMAKLKEFIKRNLQDVFGNYKKLDQNRTYAVTLAVKDNSLAASD